MFESIDLVYYIIKGAFFAGMLKAFIGSEMLMERPFFMAVLYTIGIGLLSYIYFIMPLEGPFSKQLREGWMWWLAKDFGLVWLYYWLLWRFEDKGALWWAILIIGIGLVIY
jgi:hypothetical protein